ncbi:MAG TPA: DUF177 domain-containing protein [Miltoncostaeaceae bacterium]|nr:DUF177 domain-containing protein [Miltoncostaeaceae bacterium]
MSGRDPAGDGGSAAIDLRTLDLAPGAARVLERPVPIEDVMIGGQRYRADPHEPVAWIEVSQSASGRHFRLRLAADLVGPCWRCLEEARVPVLVDTRDFAAFGRGPASEFDEDLDCEYLDGEILDLAAMARDALVEQLPAVIVCREECQGLCPVCGARRDGESCGHEPVPGDPRWAPLADLAARLGGSNGEGSTDPT